MTELLPVREELILQDDGPAVITSEQYLSDDFWNDLQDAKDEFHYRLNGLTPVASIPVTFVNKWDREGFDWRVAPAKEILRKLRIDGLDKFIVSGDRTF